MRVEDISVDSEYRKENKSTEEQLEATSYVYSIDQAERLIANFDTKNIVKFARYKADKNFGNDISKKGLWPMCPGGTLKSLGW